MTDDYTGPSSLIDQLQSKADSPGTLHQICDELGATSHLFNIYLSIAVDVPGFGQGIYIPVMISSERGGRLSGLQLGLNDETLLGIHINGTTVGLKYWTRLSGNSDIAAKGDTFRERWTTLSGNTISDGVGEVTEVDFREGHARIQFKTRLGGLGIGDINIPDMDCDCDGVAILWSLVCWGSCKCTPSKKKNA